mgnify:CR=1 FL=1
MIDTRTEKSLENVVITVNRMFYKNIIDNCTMYAVNPNGDKFWLMDNWVLAEWHDCMHSNPFESWRCFNHLAAKEAFYTIMDNTKEDE